MAYKYLRTQNGTILMYQSGDTIGPGSNHAMLGSISYPEKTSIPRNWTRQYNLENGSYILVILDYDPGEGRVTITAQFYDMYGIMRVNYYVTTRPAETDTSGLAICMQWFEQNDITYIGFNYFYLYSEATNTGFAPGSWEKVSNTAPMYNNPTQSYVGPNVYGEAIVDIEPDPFEPGGISGPGGGGMSGDPPIHDSIDFPSNPLISATNAGFVSIWTPTEKQVRDLAAYLWTTDILTGAFWKKIIQNPLDLIFGLQIMPVPIYHTEGETEPKRADEYEAMNDNVVLGWTNTRIKMDYIPIQFVEVDCGEIDMTEYWKAYLDYAPYTKIDIYLPYIGVKSLNTNDCMNRPIHLKYKIDLASGSCVAILKCDDSVYYHFSGNCASSVPLTAVQMQEVIRNAMTTAVAVGAGAIAAGAGASPIAVEASKAAVAASAARTVMSGPEYHRSGSNASTTGLMSVQTPYLIITRPRQAIPENQNTYTGYPSFITEQIGDLVGYTEVEIIHMHDMSCTNEEFKEIEELLLSGVII